MKIIHIKEHAIIVDDDIYDKVMQYTWSIIYGGPDLYYAVARLCKHKQRKHSMHRYIAYMNNVCPLSNDTMHVHHINGNGLDNRLENLSYVSRRYNRLVGKALSESGKYGEVGITFHKATNKWLVQSKINGVAGYHGVYSTIDKAKEVSLSIRANMEELK